MAVWPLGCTEYSCAAAAASQPLSSLAYGRGPGKTLLYISAQASAAAVWMPFGYIQTAHRVARVAHVMGWARNEASQSMNRAWKPLPANDDEMSSIRSKVPLLGAIHPAGFRGYCAAGHSGYAILTTVGSRCVPTAFSTDSVLHKYINMGLHLHTYLYTTPTVGIVGNLGREGPRQEVLHRRLFFPFAVSRSA